MNILQKFSKKCQANGHPDLHTYRHLWDSSSSEAENTAKNKKKNKYLQHRETALSSL